MDAAAKIDYIKKHFIRRSRSLISTMEALGVKKFCEVGVSRGDNFRGMLTIRPEAELAVAVDLWKDDGVVSHNDCLIQQDVLNQFYQSIVDLKKTHPGVEVRRCHSVDAAHYYPPDFFDFIYIDADHTYEAVKKDMEVWYPKVKPGGLFAGHDYKNVSTRSGVKFGVVSAVNEFVEKYKLQDYFWSSREKVPNWFIVKPE